MVPGPDVWANDAHLPRIAPKTFIVGVYHAFVDHHIPGFTNVKVLRSRVDREYPLVKLTPIVLVAFDAAIPAVVRQAVVGQVKPPARRATIVPLVFIARAAMACSSALRILRPNRLAIT